MYVGLIAVANLQSSSLVSFSRDKTHNTGIEANIKTDIDKQPLQTVIETAMTTNDN